MATERTEALADSLCEAIASGLSIKDACEKCGVPRFDFYSWQWDVEVFSTRVARAREAQQEVLVDEMREIADSATPEDWQVKKLQIWQRQWEAGKRAPHKFGEKQELEISGPNKGPIYYGWGDQAPKV